MRYYLTHMVVEKMPQMTSVDETIVMLNSLAQFISSGSPMLFEDDTDSGPSADINPRGYI